MVAGISYCEPRSHERLERVSVEEFSYLLGRLATQALIAEVELTPKPALVDSLSSGAHDDLSIELMYKSAQTIEPYFVKMAQTAAKAVPNFSLFERLRRIGRSAEQAMFAATNGSNTHKGAIWSLGVLIAATGIHGFSKRKAFALAATAGSIASFSENSVAAEVTHGHIVQKRFAVSGARGEAQQAFPHVLAFGLPTLRKGREQGSSETIARLDCLLSIMSHLDDTCLLYRGGKNALETAQVGARSVLSAGGSGTEVGRQRLYALDKQLLELNCSPGGSADLLAVTLFLDALERGENEIRYSQPDEEAY